MTRTLTTDIGIAAADTRVRTAHLFNASFKNSSTGVDETYYLTDNFRSVTYNGQTYTALGHLLSISGIEETTDMQIATVKVGLSGVDQTLISAVLQYLYIDRLLQIYRVFFTIPNAVWDDSDSWDDSATWSDYESAVGNAEVMIDDPVKIFEGRLDQPTIIDDPESGTCNVILSATSHFSDFQRRPGRHTNHQEHQAHFLGDRFFEFVGQFDKNLIWGRK